MYVSTKMKLIAEGIFQQDHLSMDEIPVTITNFNYTYSVQKSEVLMGYLRARESEMEGWWIPLNERLQCLSTVLSHAMLIVSPDCTAVFRDRSGRCFFFYSHSRTTDCFPYPAGDGTAVIVTFTNLKHILEIFQNRPDHAMNSCHELMPISFEKQQQPGKPYSSSACDSLSQVNLSLPKPNAGVEVSENPAEDKN